MILAVASGKGGTGKTMVATSLAVSAAGSSAVTFLDCDAEAPNAHILLKPEFESSHTVYVKVPDISAGLCNRCGKCTEACGFHALALAGSRILVFEDLCHGCGVCSYICAQHAVTERLLPVGVIETGKAGEVYFVQGRLDIGRALVAPVIKEVKKQAGRPGITIIDSPPGTSCSMVESITGSDVCLLVTEPTPFGYNDLILAVETVKQLGMPFGVIINRYGTGYTRIEEYCREQNVPVTGKIPLMQSIAVMYSNGITLAEGMPEWQPYFNQVFTRTLELAG